MGQRRAFPPIAAALVCGLVVSLLTALPIAAQRNFSDWTDSEKEAFLLNAPIVDRRPIGIGITGSEVVTLDDGEFQHDAQIQTINEREIRRLFDNGTVELNFVDCFCYNIAGYRLDRLIGLNMVPVAVLRRDGQTDAAFVWWEDEIQMMEADRYRDEIVPPSPLAWNAQVADMNVFQQLIYNTDPNLGNMLIRNDWIVKLVDFTRAFRGHNDLPTPEDLHNQLSRELYDGLRSLTLEQLEEIRGDMDGLISDRSINSILTRRDLILEHFDTLIASRGEGLVLGD